MELAIDKYIDQETDELTAALVKGDGGMLLILGFHLYTENILERIILASLQRGDRLIDNGGLSYSQKIHLVDALNIVDDQAIQALKKLNSLRNEFSHEKDKKLSLADIDLVGRPLGKNFTDFKRQHAGNLVEITRKTFVRIGVILIRVLYRAEHLPPEK